MSIAKIPREVCVEQSITDFVRTALFGEADYDASDVELLDAFPSDERRGTALDKTYVAVGFTYDEGGMPAECGSSLTRRPYNIEFFIFGHTMEWGRNVALTVKSILDTEFRAISLKDYNQSGTPEIDKILVENVRSAKQIIEDPLPWEAYVWTVTVIVVDEYQPGEI